MKPLVSIVTITRNNASGLARTLESVAAQTYGPIEHIVVDGMSADNTPEILARHPSLRVINRKPLGLYDAINTGLPETRGEIVGLLHAGDCYSAPDILEKVVVHLDHDADFVYGDVHYENATGRTVRYYSAASVCTPDLSDGYQPPHPSLYLRREAMEKIGPYKTDYIIAADFDMFLRLFADKSLKWKYLPLDMVAMSTGGVSGRWANRLFVTNHERIRAYRENGLPYSWGSILRHYLKILPGLIKPKR